MSSGAAATDGAGRIGLREVMGLVTGASAAYGVVAAVTPVLTRLYAPADFGQFQIYVMAYSFLLTVAAWRFEVAVLLPRDEADGVTVAVMGLLAVAITSVATGFGWAVMAGTGVLGGRLEVLAHFGWLLAFATAGGGATIVLMQWALREGNYRAVSVARITQSSTIAFTQLAAAFTPFAGFGLILGDAAGRLAGASGLATGAWRSHGTLVRAIRAADVRAMLVRYWRFPVISSGSALLNTGGLVLPTIFLSSFGATPLGWYALVDRLISVPSALVGMQVSQIYGAKAARLAHEDPEGLRRLFVELMGRLAWIGAVPFAAVVIAGPWMFAAVFGESWRAAGDYARVIAVAQYIAFFMQPLMPTLNILEHQSWQLGWDVGRFVLCAVLMAAAGRFVGSPLSVVIAYAVASSIGFVAHAILSYLAIRARIAVSP